MPVQILRKDKKGVDWMGGEVERNWEDLEEGKP